MKLTVKSVLAQLHLWLGLASGLVVFIVALTGSLLVFEHELEPLIDSGFHAVSVPDHQRRVPIDQLVNTATQQVGKKEISRIIVEPGPDRTVVVEFRQSKKPKDILAVALDPYTGNVVDSRQEEDAFFSVVLRLHRYLCLGDTGKIITGLSCSAFLLIMVSGLVMWWPNRKNKAQRFRVKWDASFKRLNWDLHAVLGFYVLPFVFLIALTGLVWSYKWVNNLLFYALDGKPQQKREAPANLSRPGAHQGYPLENIYAQTNRQLPHSGKILITFPEKKDQAITVSKANDEAAISNIVDFLYFDARTTHLISQRLYDQETKGFKARRLIFPIHTGSLLGWPTKLIALVVALLTATLPVTGFLVWWGKRKKKPTPKHTRQRSGMSHVPPIRKPVLK
ncbi:PepSY-associated TM helix domain-containing protein [Spirosoma sp. KUDC1026]|uniref:PepSY-associated TM helix domain-containing protein n=1 Tax=Spirosoma sp. KUDC1026 TaxID=2745947 RepID=UPI00159BD460|nr:PepSY-associated TM helix domain-containing protein [Spirosoma sp. KUDC1026]QKZ13325.1 PepSY domain-containing protein [Spirosoma sp. KUDC1026]